MRSTFKVFCCEKWERFNFPYPTISQQLYVLAEATGHPILDAIGCLTIVGTGADLINGTWYYFEGETGEAALYYASSINFVEKILKGGKFIIKALKLLQDGTVAKAAYNLDEKTVKAWKILKDAGEADGIITSEHNVSNLKLYIDAGKTDEQLVKEIKAAGGYEKWAAVAKTGDIGTSLTKADILINKLNSNLSQFANKFKTNGKIEVLEDGKSLVLKSNSGEELGKILNGKLEITNEQIVKIPKGFRPEPKLYLTAEEYAAHIDKFKNGVSCLKLKSRITPYPNLGYDDGLFIMPKAEMDALLARTGGDVKLIEKELGIPENNWYNDLFETDKPTVLVRIDIDNPQGIRMASGNEKTANELWISGGKNSGGWNEAVINPIPLTGDIWKNNIREIVVK